MGPVVDQLKRQYGNQVAFKAFVLDDLDPQSAEYTEFSRLAALAGFKVTPTFLVVTSDGKAYSRYEGATSYLSLRRDIEAVIASPPPAR